MLNKVEFLKKLAEAARLVKESGECISSREATIKSGLPIINPNDCPIEKVAYLAIKFPGDTLTLLSQVEIAWNEYQRVEQALAS